MRLTEALAVKNGEIPEEYIFNHISQDEVKEIKELRRQKEPEKSLFDE